MIVKKSIKDEVVNEKEIYEKELKKNEQIEKDLRKIYQAYEEQKGFSLKGIDTTEIAKKLIISKAKQIVNDKIQKSKREIQQIQNKIL